MNKAESFLARWSRLKREHATASSASDAKPSGLPEVSAVPQQSGMDLASLPPIESIGPGSDISAFMSEGVPPELTRDALRSAWRTDPLIREFVEIADNQWDFNQPEAIPGFGTLGAAEQARNLVAQALRIESNTAEPLASPKTGDDTPAPQVATDVLLEDSRVIDPVWRAGATSRPQLEQASAEIPEKPLAPNTPTPGRRLHGSALPK